MTLFDLTSSQKEFLLENLFDYDEMKRRNSVPAYIMYFADKHIGTAGVLFLSKNLQGVQYNVTDRGMEGELLPIAITNQMIDYINRKKFTLLPNETFQIMKNLIIWQSRS